MSSSFLFSVLSPIKNNRGMALLIALTVISLIVALTIQFNKNMRQNLLSSGIQSNRGKLEVLANSGVNLAMVVLLKDAKDNEHDSLQDSWALLADEDLSKLFDGGLLTLKIIDNSGKFQINSLVHSKNEQPEGKSPQQVIAQEQDARNILWRLLRKEPFNLEDSAARTIIDSLIDWIDTGDGDGEQEFGAESSYYLSLDPPYACKNGPVEFIEELLLVKGFTPELLFGTAKHPGLASLLTTQGNDGQININTADPLLLQALHDDMTKEMAEDLRTFRADKNNKDKLASTAWVSEVLPFFTGQNALKNITVKSHSFTIFSHAQLDSTEKNIVATVQRENQKTTLLSWKVE
jgi:general secretion pathway protein K